MTLSDVSIRNPVFSWMLMASIMLFGFIGFRKLGISQMPDVDFPVVNVSVTWTGASPEVMETNVVDVLEDSIMSVQGIRNVSSNSGYGTANISVELNLDKDVDVALQEIQTKVSQSQKLLPSTIDPPVIQKFNAEDQPIVWMAVTYNGNTKDLMMFVWDNLKTQFSTIEGVGEIRLGGYVDRNLRVWADQKKLVSLDLTVDDIINALNREHSEMPAGSIETSKSQFNVRAMGEASTVQKFAELPILSRGGSPIYGKEIRIGDVASLEDSLDDVNRISRYDGKRAVGMGIVKQRGANAVDVADSVYRKLDEVRKTLPPGFEVEIAFDHTTFIRESIQELEFTLLLAAICTGIVTYLFLGNFSSTFNILLSIPTSMMGSFLFLYFFGFTLNTFTLLGLTLAMGIVVDDAIMVLENISRHREMGKGLIRAALDGSREITFAAFATSLAILAIFIPVAFMEGIIGRYFFEFAVTISAAVMLSLLEALTLTPMRCSQFLNVGHEGLVGRNVEKAFLAIEKIYKRLLEYSLRHSKLVILLGLIFFMGSIYLLKPIKKEFVPSQDQSRVLLRLRAPIGSSLEYTDSLAQKVESYLSSRPEMDRYYSSVGGSSRSGQSNEGMIFATLKEPDERPANPKLGRPLSQSEFSANLRRELKRIVPELKVVVQDMSMRGFSSSRGFPIEFTIQGRDWDTLSEIAEKSEKVLNETGKLVDVDTNFQLGQPEIRVRPNRSASRAQGVSMSSIGNVISAMIGGVKAGQFTDGGHRYYIKIRLPAHERLEPSDIENLKVRNNRGQLVGLQNVVYLVKEPSLQSITRENRARSITVFANPAPGVGQGEAAAVAEAAIRRLIPEGYSVVASGSSKTMGESFTSLGFALLLGIVVAYMILASQFRSYMHPITVLLAMPFSFSGALLTLYLSDQSLNIYSFIALILLMGLVKKNSILLVDFANRKRQEGFGVMESISAAGPMRLRAILMTSFSTIAAAVPPALSIGPGGETRVPMALALIGGMLVSTVLTLVVVPCFYNTFPSKLRIISTEEDTPGITGNEAPSPELAAKKTKGETKKSGKKSKS